MTLSLKPITMQDAKAAVGRWHRHNRPPLGGLFAVAAESAGEVVGVVVAGRPNARALQDGSTVELTRNATDGHRNACSFLYGAARRAAVAMGYRRIYTYTLQSESGASLRAAGFVVDALLKPRATWSCPSRPRVQTDLFGTEQRPPEAKVRWVWPASARRVATCPSANPVQRPECRERSNVSTIYDPAERSVYEMAGQVMEDHHPELRGPDGTYVRLCLLMAADGSGEGEAAIKLHGYPCAAVVSIIPYKQRVDKRADVEIIIDQEWWKDATDRQRQALLDHEITHVEICKDEKGFVKTDDLGRPKLRLRLHDWQLGGFREIARRYGADAPEVEMARDFEDRFGADVLAGEEAAAG